MNCYYSKDRDNFNSFKFPTTFLIIGEFLVLFSQLKTTNFVFKESTASINLNVSQLPNNTKGVVSFHFKTLRREMSKNNATRCYYSFVQASIYTSYSIRYTQSIKCHKVLFLSAGELESTNRIFVRAPRAFLKSNFLHFPND